MSRSLKAILIALAVLLGISVIYLFIGKEVDNEVTTNPPPANNANTESQIISEGKAGPFVIGKVIPDVQGYNIRREDQLRYTEEGPEKETAYRVSGNGEDGLLIYAEKDNDSVIREIFAISSDYRTGQDIGVNSTLEEFINTYPGYKLWYTYVSDRYIVESPSLRQVQFLLDSNGYTGELHIDSEMTFLKPEEFVDTVKIQRVRIY